MKGFENSQYIPFYLTTDMHGRKTVALRPHFKGFLRRTAESCKKLEFVGFSIISALLEEKFWGADSYQTKQRIVGGTSFEIAQFRSGNLIIDICTEFLSLCIEVEEKRVKGGIKLYERIIWFSDLFNYAHNRRKNPPEMHRAVIKPTHLTPWDEKRSWGINLPKTARRATRLKFMKSLKSNEDKSR